MLALILSGAGGEWMVGIDELGVVMGVGVDFVGRWRLEM